jgi:glucosylceramidase
VVEEVALATVSKPVLPIVGLCPGVSVRHQAGSKSLLERQGASSAVIEVDGCGLSAPRIVTECTGTRDGWAGTFAWDARHLVADAVDAGSSGLLMWSLALDPRHGPVDRGSRWGCKTCRGLLTVRPGGIREEPEFYTLAHLSRAAEPGWHAVGSRAPRGLSVAAFRGPDAEVGVFAHNGTGRDRTVRVRTGGTTTRGYVVRAGELATVRLDG